MPGSACTCERVCAALVSGRRRPCEIVWANLINCLATLEALRLFVMARIERRSPAWRKTEPVYPDALPRPRPLLGGVKLRLRLVSPHDLQDALAHKPWGQRIGEYPVTKGKSTAEEMCVRIPVFLFDGSGGLKCNGRLPIPPIEILDWTALYRALTLRIEKARKHHILSGRGEEKRGGNAGQEPSRAAPSDQ